MSNLQNFLPLLSNPGTDPTIAFTPGESSVVVLFVGYAANEITLPTWRGVAPDYSLEPGSRPRVHFWRNSSAAEGNIAFTMAASAVFGQIFSMSGVDTTQMDELAGGFLLGSHLSESNSNQPRVTTVNVGEFTVETVMVIASATARVRTFGEGQTILHPADILSASQAALSTKSGTGSVSQSFSEDAYVTRGFGLLGFRPADAVAVFIQYVPYINPTTEGFTLRFTTNTANGLAYYAVYAVDTPDPIDSEIAAGTDPLFLATGNMAVSTTGEQTFPLATAGLSANLTYKVAIVHYGVSS